MSENKKVRSIADRLGIPILGACGGMPECAHSTNFLLWVFFLLLSVSIAAAEENSIPAGVEIHITAHPETAAVGDPVGIDIDVTTPRGCTVEIMEPEQQAGEFHILEFFPGPVIPVSDESGKEAQHTENRNNGSQRHQARIVTAVYKTGNFTFPALSVYITDDRGQRTEIQSPPVDIEIRSILTGNDPELKDLKKQADIPGEVPWLLWTLLAAAACILGAVALYIRRKYRKKSPSIPSVPVQDPLDLAESELRDLIARKLPENGRAKKYYVLLSEVVKRILEAAYGIAAAEQTTIEIMDSLQRHSGLSRDVPEKIRLLLLQCDVVKFAKYIPSDSENDQSAEDAFRILDQARDYTAEIRRSAVDNGPIEHQDGIREGETESPEYNRKF